MQNGGRIDPKKTANEISILLRTVLGEDRFPVDVEKLALDYSKQRFDDPITRVHGAPLDDFEGMLRPGRKKPVWHIIYNSDTRYPGRERFTLAHEFGHYLLHRTPLSEGDFIDENCSGAIAERIFSCTPLERNLWLQEQKIQEEDADTFASYLLMPLDDYREQAKSSDMSLDFLKHINERYGVSLTAAVRKWIEFTQMRAAMVVARDGFALWGRASEAALKSGIFVSSGMPIPENSIAAIGPSAQDGNANTPIQLPSGIWRFKYGAEPVRELTIFYPRLEQSLSILLFDQMDAPVEVEPKEWDTFDQFKWRR